MVLLIFTVTHMQLCEQLKLKKNFIIIFHLWGKILYTYIYRLFLLFCLFYFSFFVFAWKYEIFYPNILPDTLPQWLSKKFVYIVYFKFYGWLSSAIFFVFFCLLVNRSVLLCSVLCFYFSLLSFHSTLTFSIISKPFIIALLFRFHSFAMHARARALAHSSEYIFVAFSHNKN